MRRSAMFTAIIVICVSASISIGEYHNQGTQVWLAPAPCGDILRFVREPELSVRARQRIDVFSFYGLELFTQEGFECGRSCGPNTFSALTNVIPGGTLRWLHDHGIELAMEVGAVKEWSCTPEDVVSKAVGTALVELNNAAQAGGSLTYIKVDESFASGLNSCDLTPDVVAQLLKLYADTIHIWYPDVLIGFIEPYPIFNVEQIMSYLLELERAEVPIPFFHLDMDQNAAVNDHLNIMSDLRRLRDFCVARNIPFGVIVFGVNGRSNHEFAAGAWASVRTIRAAIGTSDHLIFQSWSLDNDETMRIPDLVPETDPETHLGQLIGQLDYLNIKPIS